MEDVAHAGRTVLFVSHQLGAITTLCDRAVWLDAGSVREVGRPDEVVAAYVKAGVESSAVAEWPAGEISDGHVDVRRVAILQGAEPAASIDIRHPFSVEIDYDIVDPVPGLRVGFRLAGADGTAVFTGMDRPGGSSEGYRRGAGRYRSRCEVPGHLLNAGRFAVGPLSDLPNRGALVWVPDAVQFDVVRTGGISAADASPWEGFLLPDLEWRVTNI
jgi:lipopolysaccharide transport system ATP-binding protein